MGDEEKTKLVVVLPPRLMRAVRESAEERNWLPTELVRHAVRAFLVQGISDTDADGEPTEGAA